MRTRARLLTLIGSFAVFVATAGDKEPTYEGRSLSQWLGDLDPHLIYEVNHPPLEVDAIRHIGTNSLPLLLKWMAATDPHETPKPNLAPCFNTTRSQRAALAFDILGETATPAIPELTRLAMSLPSRDRYERCIGALAAIGPDSLPSFEVILTKGTAGRKFSAIEYLPVFHTHAAVVLPAVIKCLAGRNEDVGWKAADELSRLEISGAVVVHALTNALPSASASARARILRCLCWLEYPAREAAPAIRKALSDANSEVRTNATYAAQRIAPELLINRRSK